MCAKKVQLMCQASSKSCENNNEFFNTQRPFKNAQRLAGQQPLALIKGNFTRWNSILELCSQFNNLKLYLTVVVSRDVSDFPWTKLEHLVKTLKPLKKITLDI